MIGKKKIAILLILWLIICSGIYIAAVKSGIWYIPIIYIAVGVVLIFLYIPPFLKSVKIKSGAAEDMRSYTAQEQVTIDKLNIRMKYLILIFTPIIIVLLCDYLYITLLSQLGFLKFITDYYK